MSRTPVVVLGTGDVLRALDPEGGWYWTGAKPQVGVGVGAVKDPEVGTGRRDDVDRMILADIFAASFHHGDTESTERKKKGWITPSTPMLVGMPGGGVKVIHIKQREPKASDYIDSLAYGAEAMRNFRRHSWWSRLRARLCALCVSVVKFLDRDRLWLAVLMLATCLALTMAGCAARVGTRFDQDQAGRSSINGGPNRLAVNFPDSETTSTEGVGPSSYSVTSGDEVRTLNQGVTPRQIFFKKLPDGTLAVNVSSGSDVEAEGLVYEPESGTFAVERFRTLTSEPIRAGNEGYTALVGYWQARDEASRAVLIEQIRASTEIATDLKGVLIGALTGIP